jgi:hypothetical protein
MSAIAKALEETGQGRIYMVTRSTTISKELQAQSVRPKKKWTQKVRREFGRLVYHVNTLWMRPRALTARNQFLFILGHMRSGSTLLSHLLCSSDDILGFGECHNNYRRRSDLAKLLMSVRSHTDQNPLKYRYVLDKIVGTQHTMSASVLTDRRTRYVFLVREPLASLASIVAMRRHFHPDETAEQVLAFAIQHYTERLGQLLQSSETIDDPERCLLVTHQQVLNETPTTFKAFESFLELSAPLREEYDITPTTGQPGIGDPFGNIRLGKINRSLPKKHVDLSATQREKVERCYETFLNKLAARIPTPSSPPCTNRMRAA